MLPCVIVYAQCDEMLSKFRDNFQEKLMEKYGENHLQNVLLNVAKRFLTFPKPGNYYNHVSLLFNSFIHSPPYQRCSDLVQDFQVQLHHGQQAVILGLGTGDLSFWGIYEDLCRHFEELCHNPEKFICQK